MDVHPTKNGINRYWSIVIEQISMVFIVDLAINNGDNHKHG